MKSQTQPLFWAVAAFALGQAIQADEGISHAMGLVWLNLSLMSALVAVFGSELRDPAIGRWTAAVLSVGLVIEAWELFLPLPGWWSICGTALALACCTGLVVAAWLPAGRGARLRRAAFPVAIVTYCVLGIWVIRFSGDYFLDVLLFHQEATAALMHGVNPYAIRFPDHYQGAGPYLPEQSVNGRLTFGFPYPPLSLLMAMPGALMGDPRYSHLVAMALASVLMATARRGRLSKLAAALVLFSPASFYLLRGGWTEPFAVLLLAGAIWSAERTPRLLPLLLGLLLAVKQHMLFVVPLTLLLLPRPWKVSAIWKVLWRSILVALLVQIPFFIWDPGQFLHSLTALGKHPFRSDSLTYSSWFHAMWNVTLPAWAPLAAGAAAVAVALRKFERTPAGFALAVGFTYLVVFASSDRAFGNHYYFVLGALCNGIAVHDSSREGQSASGLAD